MAPRGKHLFVLFLLLSASQLEGFGASQTLEVSVAEFGNDQDTRANAWQFTNMKPARENVRHVWFARPRGNGYFASTINRYANSTSCFQLVRLVISGFISPNPGPVFISTSNSINSSRRNYRSQQNLSNINIAHLNIRCSTNREHYILAKEAVIGNKLDVFTVSETWLDSTILDVEVEFPGFYIYRLDRDTRTGGGVRVFVKQDFKVERLHDLSFISESDLHMLWVKIQVRNFESFLICMVYRPPTTFVSCFDVDSSNNLVAALSFNKPIYILGDLNCNVLNANDPACQALMNFCSSFNLYTVNKPTDEGNRNFGNFNRRFICFEPKFSDRN